MREILVPVFRKGECVYQSPSVMEIAEYCKQEKKTLWDETKRLSIHIRYMLTFLKAYIR